MKNTLNLTMIKNHTLKHTLMELIEKMENMMMKNTMMNIILMIPLRKADLIASDLGLVIWGGI